MDEMQYYEIVDAMNLLGYCFRDEWERTRMLLSPYCKDAKKVMPFPWDVKEEDGDEADLDMVKAWGATIEAMQNR